MRAALEQTLPPPPDSGIGNSIIQRANVPNVRTEVDWNEGRRVVELGVLAEELAKCNGEGCNLPQNLNNTEKETRSGLGSLLWVRCVCGFLNKVKTSKCRKVSEKAFSFDVNTKAAAGMIHAGMNYNELKRFTSNLQIPPPDRKTIKQGERKIGPVIEYVAHSACNIAKTLERDANTRALGTDAGGKVVELTAGFDMGWQRRSSGRSYNSLSGHGVLIGEKTDLVLEFGSRIKNCKQCEVNNKRGVIKKHDCRMNWGGSSKAMEADLAVELVKKSNCETFRVSTLICDEDATTIAKVRDNVPFDVRKQSDRNHIRKNIGNDLYALQKTHRVLQTNVINYFKKCFSYVVKQNENNPEGTKAAILTIVPHVFGEHEHCGGSWCKFKENPSRKYKHLPYKRPLTSSDLRASLERVFCKNAANSSNICPNASSNSNESFNTVVASKARKSCHFSNSESFDFRLAAAVCQKNMGDNYMHSVYESLGLSPGKVSDATAHTTEKTFQKRKAQSSTVEAKRKRLHLKQSRNESMMQKEVREGITYQTSICLDPLRATDVQEIPPATILPSVEVINPDKLTECQICIFDLETTSLSDDCDLVQIAAVTLDGKTSFNQYILPCTGITSRASKVTGLTVKGGNLFSYCKLVQSVGLKEGLLRFSAWLFTLKVDIILVAHNAKAFDVKHFVRHINNHQLQEKFVMICGFVDTLLMYKSLHPEQTSYSQENLYKNLVGGKYKAHDALEDVRALSELLRTTVTDKSIFATFSMTWSWSIAYLTFLQQKRANVETFSPLLSSNSISKGMAEKAASTGLTYQHLQLSFERNGEMGIKSLLSETFEGITRVTKDKKVISSIIGYFNPSQ